LSIATEVGDIDVVRLLIESGADVNAIDQNMWPCGKDLSFEGYMPSDGFLQYVDCFVSDAGSNATKQNPLLLAAEFKHVGVMELLIEANADVNKRDLKGRTALTWAVEQRFEPAVWLLLANPEIESDCRDEHGQTPFSLAARMGEVRILKELLKRNPDVNSEDEKQRTPLIWAVKNRHKSAVELLLTLTGIGIDHHDDQGRTPFSFAAQNESVEIMLALLEKLADPHRSDHQGRTGFWWFLNSRKEWFNSLANAKVADVNPFCLPALVRALPKPDRPDSSGRNWLSWAASYGDSAVVEYLLDEGKVDVNTRDTSQGTFSKTPLIWALENGDKATIDLLKVRDNLSLHVLVEELQSPRKNHPDEVRKDNLIKLIKALVNTDYNLNQPDSNGRTPLHLACLDGDEEAVCALVAKADLNCKDHTAKIPLQYALATKKNMNVVYLLLDTPAADIRPICSEEWFNLREPRPSWIQITKRIQSKGFDLKLVDGPECDWLPRAKECTLW
jgi:ankyrin repeat protein